MGYSSNMKGYKCYDLQTGKVFVSRHVQFREEEFPFAQQHSLSSAPEQLPLLRLDFNILFPFSFGKIFLSDSTNKNITKPVSSVGSPQTQNNHQRPFLNFSNSGNLSHIQPVAPDNFSFSSLNPNTCFPSSDQDLTSNPLPHNDLVSSPLNQYNSSLPLNDVNMLQPVTSSSLPEYSTSNLNQNLTNNSTSSPQKYLIVPHLTTNTHSMVMRSKNGIHELSMRYCLQADVKSDVEPTSYIEVVRFEHWRRAMQEEFDALKHQGTWRLVPPSQDQKLIGYHWVFKIKKGFNRKSGSLQSLVGCERF